MSVMGNGRGATTWAVVRAVGARPSVWREAVRTGRRLVPDRWWARPPFVPVPPGPYLRFRLETQYGGTGRPEPEDVVSYLRWCRALDLPGRRSRPTKSPSDRGTGA